MRIVKLCSTCKEEKSLCSFHKKAAAKDGLSYTCKDCSKARTKRLYQENKGDKQKYSYDKRRSDREGVMLSQAKIRAKREGIPFDITKEDIKIPLLCPILKIPLAVGTKEGSPSLDRLIPEVGYVKGNINVISQRANRIKNDSSLQELESIVDWITQLTKRQRLE